MDTPKQINAAKADVWREMYMEERTRRQNAENMLREIRKSIQQTREVLGTAYVAIDKIGQETEKI